MNCWIISKEDDFSSIVKDRLHREIRLPFDEENPKLVIAVGGDGTFINAVHRYPRAIIFGVHTGHLGFFSNYTVDDLDLLISDINNNEFKIDKVDLLKCSIEANNKKVIDYAVNEMTIIMPPRTLILNVFVDDKKLEKFRGTGFCISTQYGSTAYNKSLHGAVIDPEIKAFQITEIAGINSNAYRTLSSPFVLGKNRVIKFEALDNEEVYVTIDNISYNFSNFKKATVSLMPNSVSLAYHHKPEFIERIKRTFLINE